MPFQVKDVIRIHIILQIEFLDLVIKLSLTYFNLIWATGPVIIEPSILEEHQTLKMMPTSSVESG